jgi:hypothetical protein
MSSLFAAWQQWLQGHAVITGAFLNISFLWWGRIGKILEFFAGLTIVAEIAGPARIRKAGASLRQLTSFHLGSLLARSTLRWFRLTWRYYHADEKLLPQDERELDDSLISIVAVLPSIAAAIIAARTVARLGAAWYWSLLSGVIVGGVFAATIVPIALVLLLLGISFSAVVVDVMVARPLAWVLDRDTADRWLKVLAAAMLIIGFHFDLLAG